MLDRHRPDIPLGIQMEQLAGVDEIANLHAGGLPAFHPFRSINPPTAISRSIRLPSHSERDVSAETSTPDSATMASMSCTRSGGLGCRRPQFASKSSVPDEREPIVQAVTPWICAS